MKQKKLITAVIALCVFTFVEAQQIHFSQFFLSPQSTNPAQTGMFNGTVRIGGLHRTQWANTEEKGTNTTALFIDSPISRGFRVNDWVGVGFGINNDVSGIGLINTININLGLSYHLALNKDQTSVISLGGMYSGSSLNIDNSDLRFADFYTNQPALDQNRINSQVSQSFSDFSAGLQWRQRMNDRMSFDLSYAIYHINTPEVSFFESKLNDSVQTPTLPRKNTISGRFSLQMSEKLILEPLFLIQNIEADSEFLVGATMLSPIGKKETQLRYGAAYRLRDALVFYLGLVNEDYQLGLSYDLTISEFAAYTPINFELGAHYIIRKYKRPTINPFIFCPRY